MANSSLWRAQSPLILASRSAGRRMLLEAAGVPVRCIPADIDERAMEGAIAGSQRLAADDLSLALSREKAFEVSRRLPEDFVLGCDQVLSCDGRILHKASSREEARAQLAALSGRMHVLYSAAVLAKAGKALAVTVDKASMLMRPLSEAFLDAYVSLEEDALLASVGSYAIEGIGSQLFASVEGNHFTIVGLPLFPVLDMLRNEGLLLR